MASIQLPYCSYLLLHIDIPALAATRDGWNALKASVCKLFTRSGDVRRRVIGFASKDDIRRRRVRQGGALVPTDEPTRWRTRASALWSVSIPSTDAEQLDKAKQCSDLLIRPLSPEQEMLVSMRGHAQKYIRRS